MERTELPVQRIKEAIINYWNTSQDSLEMIKKGIESNNFSLIYDSCLMSRGYLEVISGYARKAFEDMFVVSEDAEYEPPKQEAANEDESNENNDIIEDVEATVEDADETPDDTNGDAESSEPREGEDS